MQRVFRPKDLVEWFKENPDMMNVMPWGANLVAHSDSIGKGCKCKRKSKISNLMKVYKNIVLEIFTQNSHHVALMKRELQVDKIVFMVEDDIIKEF